MLFFLTNCFTIHHKVVIDAQGNTTTTDRQLYILWDLAINQFDTRAIAGRATDYELIIQPTAVDVRIGVFTQLLTVYPVSVEVKK